MGSAAALAAPASRQVMENVGRFTDIQLKQAKAVPPSAASGDRTALTPCVVLGTASTHNAGALAEIVERGVKGVHERRKARVHRLGQLEAATCLDVGKSMQAGPHDADRVDFEIIRHVVAPDDGAKHLNGT